MSGIYKHHIESKDTLTLVMDDGIIPIAKKHPCFDVIKQRLKDHCYDDLALFIAKGSPSVSKLIFERSKGAFTAKGGQIVYKGKELPKVLSARVYEMLKAKLPLDSFNKFWEKLSRNPSTKSRESLYTFLEKNHIPINEDGDIILYKRLNEDWTDCHTGTVDNHPGKVIKMSRKSVDSDEFLNCSNGYHVASHSFAKAFNQGQGKFIEVRVNPKDVVSVPHDANCQKMRVCEYEVLHEVGAEEKPAQEITYKYRTYYYKGNRNKVFAERMVTGKKPSRFIKTCRAVNTAEAVEIFRKNYTEK